MGRIRVTLSGMIAMDPAEALMRTMHVTLLCWVLLHLPLDRVKRCSSVCTSGRMFQRFGSASPSSRQQEGPEGLV